MFARVKQKLAYIHKTETQLFIYATYIDDDTKHMCVYRIENEL